jgi:hypothetical protein
METQQKRKNEMENTRYNFSGFTFGMDKNLYNLTIRLNNHAGYGTSYIGEMSLELNDTERQALINLLMNPQETN